MKKILLILLLCIVVVACSNKENINKQVKHKLKIVATTFPQYDFIRAIAKDKVELKLLIKPGIETHNYEPSPSDIKLLGNSDIVVNIGAHNDVWVSKIIEELTHKPTLISLVNLTNVLTDEIKEGMTNINANPNLVDEHVWTDPNKVIEIVQKLTDLLSEKDPNNASEYTKNAQEYISKLKKLDQDFKALANKAKNKTIIVADRFPFRYLVERYGFNYYAAFSGCSHETEVSAKTVKFLIDKVEQLAIPFIYTIEFSNQKIAKSISHDTNVKILNLHSAHNISPQDFNQGLTYLDIMQHNLNNLKSVIN